MVNQFPKGQAAGFWLPAKNDTLTQLHLIGKSHLTIDYTDYQVTRAATASVIPADGPVLRGESGHQDGSGAGTN